MCPDEQKCAVSRDINLLIHTKLVNWGFLFQCGEQITDLGAKVPMNILDMTGGLRGPQNTSYIGKNWPFKNKIKQGRIHGHKSLLVGQKSESVTDGRTNQRTNKPTDGRTHAHLIDELWSIFFIFFSLKAIYSHFLAILGAPSGPPFVPNVSKWTLAPSSIVNSPQWSKKQQFSQVLCVWAGSYP